MPVGSIAVDETRWPILTATFRGVAALHDLEVLLEAQARAVQSGTTHVLIVDALHAIAVPALLFARLRDWHDQHYDALARSRVGTAFATQSPLMRGTIALWARRLPHAATFVATRADAEAWALERLQAEGVKLASRSASRPPRSCGSP